MMRRHVARRCRRVVVHREVPAKRRLLVRRRNSIGDSTSSSRSGSTDPKTFDFSSQTVNLPGHVRVVTLERLDVVDS